jgi:hypothetical protein
MVGMEGNLFGTGTKHRSMGVREAFAAAAREARKGSAGRRYGATHNTPHPPVKRTKILNLPRFGSFPQAPRRVLNFALWRPLFAGRIV